MWRWLIFLFKYLHNVMSMTSQDIRIILGLPIFFLSSSKKIHLEWIFKYGQSGLIHPNSLHSILATGKTPVVSGGLLSPLKKRQSAYPQSKSASLYPAVALAPWKLFSVTAMRHCPGSWVPFRLNLERLSLFQLLYSVITNGVFYGNAKIAVHSTLGSHSSDSSPCLPGSVCVTRALAPDKKLSGPPHVFLRRWMLAFEKHQNINCLLQLKNGGLSFCSHESSWDAILAKLRLSRW